MPDNDNDAEATIARAIQSARYNEAVVVTTVNEGASPSEIVLVACLDSEHGGIIWKNCADADAIININDADATTTATTSTQGATAAGRNSFKKTDPGIVRHLRTKRWALPMLNDHRRNHLYDMAVRNACRQMVTKRASECSAEGNSVDDGNGDDKKEDEEVRILDIGSGTGLLAMMAARHTLNAIQEQEETSSTDGTGIKPKVQVTSVEMASAMARLARMTIDENGLSDNIAVVEHHSTDANFGIDDARFGGGGDTKKLTCDRQGVDSEAVCDVKDGAEIIGNATYEKADICTSELLESGLLGEGVLPSMRDAWERHLKPDAIVIPRRARVYAVLVEGMPIMKRDAHSSTGDETTLNCCTSFLGPELISFHKASGGVWMSTSAPSSTNEIGDKPTDHCNQLNNQGILLGARHCENTTEGRAVGGVIIPLHANAMLDKTYRDKATNLMNDEGVHNFRGIRPLTDPTMVLEFDFASGLDALPPPTGRSITTKNVIPTADGVCHGVLYWWELDLWDGDPDTCTYSTKPIDAKSGNSKDGSKSLWQDHWQQCLFVFGDGHSERNPEGSRNLTKGSPMEIIASHDDCSVSFSINTGASSTRLNEDIIQNRPNQRRRLNEDNRAMLNCHITSTRALQLNDSSRIRTLTAAIHHCIDVKGSDAPILDLSDFGLCAMIAALYGAQKVTSLESSSGSLPTLAATVAQIGNGLPRVNSEFQIIQALAEHISEEHIVGGAAEIVVAEPYYEMLEGWHLQELLNYFYLVRSLKKRGVIAKCALSVPAYAHVMAVCVEFDDYYSAYGAVGDQSNGGLVAGFRHASVNYYGNRYETYDTSLPLFQYRYKPLSRSFCIAKFSYEGTEPTIDTVHDAVELVSEGLAQAVVFWVDYGCRTNNGDSEDHFDIISTASSSHRQLVRKLPKQISITKEDVKAGAKFCCKASFGDDPNGIEDHSFLFEFYRKEDEMNTRND